MGTGGLLMGLWGRSGQGVDQIGFTFAGGKIVGKRIDEVVYTPNLEDVNELGTNEERGFTVTRHDSMVHTNNLDKDTQIRFSGSTGIKESNSWTESTAHTFGISVGFEFKVEWGLPMLAGGSLSMKTDMKYEMKRENSETTGHEETVSCFDHSISSVPTNREDKIKSLTYRSPFLARHHLDANAHRRAR